MSNPNEFLNQLYQHSIDQGLALQSQPLSQPTGAERFIQMLRQGKADAATEAKTLEAQKAAVAGSRQKAFATMAALAEKAGPYAKDAESFSSSLAEMGKSLIPDVDPEDLKNLANSFAGARFQLGQRNADTRQMAANTGQQVAQQGTIPLRQAQTGLAEANTGMVGAKQASVEAGLPGIEANSATQEELRRSQIWKN